MSTGTEVEVVMPQMGVSVSEGTVTRWLKQAGDAISLDEPLLEISTDKVDTEVPSPGEGVVAEIRVQEGETVEVGTVLALIRPAGGEAAPPEPTPAPAGEQELVDEPQAAQPEAEPVAEAPAEPASSASEPEAAEPVVARAPVQERGTAERSSHPLSPGSPPSTASTQVVSRGPARAAA